MVPRETIVSFVFLLSPNVSLNFISGKHQDSWENKTNNCFPRDHTLSVIKRPEY